MEGAHSMLRNRLILMLGFITVVTAGAYLGTLLIPAAFGPFVLRAFFGTSIAVALYFTAIIYATSRR